jgi:hypothetical protein
MYLKTLTQKNKRDGHVRKYLQIVESRRVNGSPRQKVLLTLGRVDTPEGKKILESLADAFVKASERLNLLDVRDDLRAHSSKEFGTTLIFRRIWEDLNLAGLLGTEMNEVEAEFDPVEAVFNMVLNRLSAPSSKRQLETWQKSMEGIESFDLHQYYRALDYLIDHKDALEKIKSGKLTAIVENTHYKRFLRIKGEKPVVDDEKVKRDEMYDGMFVLTTNTTQSAVGVVAAYKDLWQVELAFRQLKSELEMGPIYHWKDRRIRAHVMICFLAFVLRTVFYKRLKKEDRDMSYTGIMADLKALRTCELTAKGELIKLRTELQPGAVKAFRAIGMRPPSHLLSEVTLENVVIRL